MRSCSRRIRHAIQQANGGQNHRGHSGQGEEILEEAAALRMTRSKGQRRGSQLIVVYGRRRKERQLLRARALWPGRTLLVLFVAQRLENGSRGRGHLPLIGDEKMIEHHTLLCAHMARFSEEGRTRRAAWHMRAQLAQLTFVLQIPYI